MAKKKKGPSIVSTSNIDRLPDPEEAARRAGEVARQVDPEAKKKKPAETSNDSKKDWKRTTILVKPGIVARMKVVAAKQQKYIYEVMNEAMTKYLEDNE